MTIFNSLTEYNAYGRAIITDDWQVILANKHVLRDFKMIDELELQHDYQTRLLKFEMQNAGYDKFYGLIQWVLREETVPDDFSDQIAQVLEHCRSPFRVVGGDTLIPVANDEMANAIDLGVAAAKDHGLAGAEAHLKLSASLLTEGKWADSVRESLHAVESCARLLAPGSNGLGLALKVLSEDGRLHEAMKKGFAALYGYASDEKGIRHPLLETGDANVSEHDAMFMIGACASFVSYLLAQQRKQD